MNKIKKSTSSDVLLIFKPDKYHNRNLARAEGEGFEPSRHYNATTHRLAIYCLTN